MAKATLPKLSPAQLAALQNVDLGHPTYHGLRNQSQMGGHNATIVSLRTRGLLDDKHQLTPSGHAALKEHRKG